MRGAVAAVVMIAVHFGLPRELRIAWAALATNKSRPQSQHSRGPLPWCAKKVRGGATIGDVAPQTDYACP